MIRRLPGIVLGLLIALMGALPLSADHTSASPDTIRFIQSYGYGNIDEPGDILLVIEYNVNYTVLPDVTATDGLLGQYLDGTSPIRSTAPFTFVRSGWGHGVMGIYFTPVEATAAGIAYDDPDNARLASNPGVFISSWSVTEPIVWRGSGADSTLATDIVSIGEDLEIETEWAGVNLVEQAFGNPTILQTPDGEDYFTRSVPRLRQGASGIFEASIQTPQFVEDTFTQSYRTELAEALDSSSLANSTTGLAAWLNMPEMAVRSTVVFIAGFIAAAFLAGIAIKMGVDPSTGGAASVVLLLIILLGATRIGFFDLAAMALIGFCGLLLIGATMWGRRT